MHLLRYEDLVVRPKVEIEAICQFLGLGFEDGMLANHHTIASQVINLNAEPWKRDNLSNKLQDNRYKWRSKLPSRKIWMIEEMCSQYMDYFKYERTVESTLLERKVGRIEDKIHKYIILKATSDY
jgi:hypothetical protein